MIIRIVKLTLQEDCISDFLATFKKQQEHIAGFDGCHHVSLLRDERNPNIFFTYSHWDGLDDLERYRQSTFFQGIWKKVKPMFAEKAAAWSTQKFDV